MTIILPAIPGLTTFSCQSATHYKCSGSRWSFSKGASIACACDCHEVGQLAFDMETIRNG